MYYFNKPCSKLSASLVVTSVIFCSPTLANEPNDKMLEEVVVTGQKISRSLQDTPTSVAVINSVQIEERDISKFSDFLLETANAHSESNGDLSIRGIDAFGVSGAGDSFLASVYVDGAPLPRQLIRSGFTTWDASQVEILRGPQSTLQGRNALAGAVVISTNKPTHEWEGKYRAQFGENSEQELAFAGGGSLIEDQLAFRFTAELEETDGFNRNITRNEAADFSDSELYRLKFLLTPSSVENFSALLSFTHATHELGSTGVNVPESGSPFEDRVITNDAPQNVDRETDLVNLNLNYDFNDTWSLTSVSTYTDVHAYWDNYDNDNGPEALSTRGFDEENQTISQEFRLTFNYENLTGLIGAYYFDQDIATLATGDLRLGLSGVGVNAPFFQAQFGLDRATADFVVAQYAPLDPAVLGNIATTDRQISSLALFADARYTVNDKWDIFGGIRWDREDQENASTATRVLLNADAIPDPSIYPTPLNFLIGGINAQLLSNVEEANRDIPLVDDSFDEVLPKLGVSYHWTDDLTTSLSYQLGYRSGGVGVNPARSLPFQFDAEYTDNIEFSLRSKWLDGRLTANANFFHIDWEDQQVNVQLSSNSFDSETQNAGSSTVSGFELELNYQATNDLTLYGSVGQAKTKFEDFTVIVPTPSGVPVVFDLGGRPFADAPEITANIGATYRADSGIFVNLNANYADGSPRFVNPYSAGQIEGDANFDPYNDSRVLVNAQIGYTWETFGVYLVASNLLDEEYVSGVNTYSPRSINRQTLGDPRQLSVSLRGNF